MKAETTAFIPAHPPRRVTRLQSRLRLQHALLLALLAYVAISVGRAVHHQHYGSDVGGPRWGLVPGGVRRLLRSLVDDSADFRACQAADAETPLPALRLLRRWHSGKQRLRRSVTLVTQLSLERLDMLESQCGMWGDVLAAAVYVPLVHGRVLSAGDKALNGASVEQAAQILGKFHAAMDAKASTCLLDLELVGESFSSPAQAGLYPFNAVRNRALGLAATEAVLLLDVDFLPAPGVVPGYQDTAEGYRELMAQLRRREAVVLPAFETARLKGGLPEGEALAKEAVLSGKSGAVSMYRAGKLLGFQVGVYPQGHSPTNYLRWSGSDRPYPVYYRKGYEPYVLIARRYVPWYDERFRGYGRDKIVHLTHIAGLGVRFSVHPSAYVVHVPHKKAPTYKATKQSGQWDKLYHLYREVQKDIRHKRYSPVTSFADRC